MTTPTRQRARVVVSRRRHGRGCGDARGGDLHRNDHRVHAALRGRALSLPLRRLDRSALLRAHHRRLCRIVKRRNAPMHRPRTLALALLAALVLAHAARGQSFDVIHDFAGEDGYDPNGRLLQVGSDFFGTTGLGGAAGSGCPLECGTTFRMDADGTVTTLHTFQEATEGVRPGTGLVLASDGNYYGTTNFGGQFGDGTTYRMDSSGAVTTLHEFDRETGGWLPESALIVGTDGHLYGTTTFGRCEDLTDNCAVVYRMTLGGGVTALHTFGPDPDGGLAAGGSGDPGRQRRLLRNDEPRRRRKPHGVRSRLRNDFSHDLQRRRRRRCMLSIPTTATSRVARSSSRATGRFTGSRCSAARTTGAASSGSTRSETSSLSTASTGRTGGFPLSGLIEADGRPLLRDDGIRGQPRQRDALPDGLNRQRRRRCTTSTAPGLQLPLGLTRPRPRSSSRAATAGSTACASGAAPTTRGSPSGSRPSLRPVIARTRSCAATRWRCSC